MGARGDNILAVHELKPLPLRRPPMRDASTAMSPMCCFTSRDRPLSQLVAEHHEKLIEIETEIEIDTGTMTKVPMMMPLYGTDGRSGPHEAGSEHS